MAPPPTKAIEQTDDDTGLEGRTIPDVELHVLDGDGRFRVVRAADLFGRGTTVIFTPSHPSSLGCSDSRVPRFQQLAGELHSHGVDRIVCVAVNDPAAVGRSAREQHAEGIAIVADVEGCFTGALGMLVDGGGSAPGTRSRSYSALVRDGAVVKAFVDPETEGAPLTVSDADTMLRYLDPATTTLRSVALLARHGCPHCERARRLLADHGFRFEAIELNEHITLQAVRAISGRATVPQVFVDGHHVGGADELAAWLEQDEARRQGALEAPTG
jgi:glutaredoxin-like protein